MTDIMRIIFRFQKKRNKNNSQNNIYYYLFLWTNRELDQIQNINISGESQQYRYQNIF